MNVLQIVFIVAMIIWLLGVISGNRVPGAVTDAAGWIAVLCVGITAGLL